MANARQSRRHALLWMAAGAGVLLLVGAIATLFVLYSGFYNVAARTGHTRIVFWLLDTGMRNSVRHHAAELRPPADLAEPRVLRSGASCFRENCVQCHGAPGLAPGRAAGLMPVADNLAQTGRDWPLHEIYWVTRNGIGMTGMPSWEFRLDDRELWAVAAFVKHGLPGLTAAEYSDLLARDAGCPSRVAKVVDPDPERGRAAMRMYACHACHRVPGIVGSDIHVGPPLEGFASRPLIAGAVVNNRENLLRWLLDPQSLRPRTLMPDVGLSEGDAADIAAYLATLEQEK